MKNNLEFILNNKLDLLKYIKSRIPMFHKSNIFFRDIQYAIRGFLELKTKRVSYDESEKLAEAFIKHLENEGILKKVNFQGYVVNYPEFKTPSPEKNKAA